MMNYKVLLIAILGISTSFIYAQTPEQIKILQGEKELACAAAQNAGSVNSITPDPANTGSLIDFADTTFLCFQDGARAIHNGNYVLDGDPNPATPAEIGYAFYSCSPSVFGDELSNIQADPCAINQPPTPNGVYIARGAPLPNPDLVMNNDGSINQLFSAGAPTLVHFAPITYDDYNNGPIYENSGSCVNANILSEFLVVYLNEIEMVNLTTAGLSGEFSLRGGYPEWNPNSFYNLVSIENSANPAITGTFNSNTINANGTAEFTVPEDGTYTIWVEDGKTSCLTSFEVTINTDAVLFDIGELEVDLGDNFCLPITVSNFDSITSITFVLTFDPNVINYDTYQNWALSTGGIFAINDNNADQGFISLLWSSDNILAGENLSDGSVLIELCFTTAPNATVGDMTSLTLTSNNITFLEVLGGANSDMLDVNIDPGKVTIRSTDLVGTAVSCGSLSARTDGTLGITAFSGTAPYTVDVTGPQNRNGNIPAEGGTVSFNNLPPGNYNIRITDNTGATFDFTKEVYDGGPNNQPRPNFDLDEIQKPSCFNSTDGSIGITYNSGDIADPFEIAWSTGQFNVDFIEDLGQGTYFVTVTDRFGCEEVENTTVSQSIIQAVANVTNASCSGYSDGSAIVTATGGTPENGTDYTFRWSAGGGGVQTGTQANIPNLGAGWTRVTITDDNNCQVVDSFFVSADRRIVLQNLNITDVSCAGGQNGALSITAGTIGGTANLPYTISVFDENNIDVSSPIGQTGAIAAGLRAGSYDIVITDMTSPNPCQFDTTIIVEEPDPIIIDVDKRDETCVGGGNDGTITLDVSGGTVAGSYNYNWDNNLANSDSHSNLAPGVYNVTVTDDNLCTATQSIRIEAAQPPSLISIDATPPSCPETCDGEITINVQANPDFDIVRYRIIRNNVPFDTLTNETSLTIGGYCGGELYQVLQIEDEAGCIARPPTFDEFPERDSLELDTAYLINPSCNGRTDGRIVLNMQGATAPYIYQWDGLATDTSFIADTLTNLSAGTYRVTVSDINDCGNLELEFTITDPPLLDANFSNVTDASCFNSCDAEATVTASGGNPLAGSYDYEWSSGATGSGADHTTDDLCPGEQFVIISDGVCIDTFLLTIDAPDSISIDTLNFQLPSCFGLSDGNLSLQASGGAGGFSYNWTNGPNSNNFDNLSSGVYILSTTDANGCERIDSIELPDPDSLIAFFDPANILDPSCPGETDGMLNLSVLGGTGFSFNYVWTDSVSNRAEASGLDVGRYAVTVTDENGCSDTASAELVTAPPIVPILPIPDTPDCSDGSVAYLISSVQGGNGGPYTYNVDGSPLSPVGVPVQSMAGDVLVSVTDRNGCVFDTVITIPSRAPINININPVQELRLGTSLTFTPIVEGPFPIISYSWTPSEGLSCTDCPNPEVNPSVNTIYTLTVTDANGCTAEANVAVNLNTRREIYIPNAFSPNADDINDFFRVYSGPGVASINALQIYDRWGNLVWEGSNIAPSPDGSDGWDGTYLGRPADPGVYVYSIEILFLDGRVITYRGDVALVNGLVKN